jgi:hypothetical protein
MITARFKVLLLVLSGLVVISGCSSMMPLKAYSLQIANPPTAVPAAKNPVLLKLGQHLDQPYTVLGKVMAYKRGGLGATRELNYVSTPPKELVAALRQPARNMGADAVIGIYHGEYRGVNMAGEYVSGLAVAYLSAGAVAQAQADLRVGILPVQTGKSTIDAKDYAKIDRDFRVGARWLLENKGYYAPIDTKVKFKGGIDDLITLSPATMDGLYGRHTEFLLLLELLDEQSFTPILVEQRKVVLKASLFSKSLRKVVWENTVAKEQVTGVFWSWMSTGMARASAIESVLKPLPFYMRSSGREFTAYPPDMVKKMVLEK